MFINSSVIAVVLNEHYVVKKSICEDTSFLSEIQCVLCCNV